MKKTFWQRVDYLRELQDERIRIKQRKAFAELLLPPPGSPPFAIMWSLR